MRVIRPFVAALFVVAACTGSVEKTSTPNEFVDAACADLSAWSTAVSGAFADVQGLRQLGTSSDSVAEEALLLKLTTSLRDAENATAQLAKGISTRGAPNIADGEAIKNSILDTLDRLRELLRTTRHEVDAFEIEHRDQGADRRAAAEDRRVDDERRRDLRQAGAAQPEQRTAGRVPGLSVLPGTQLEPRSLILEAIRSGFRTVLPRVRRIRPRSRRRRGPWRPRRAARIPRQCRSSPRTG